MIYWDYEVWSINLKLIDLDLEQMQEQLIVGNKWLKITSFANHNNAHKVRLSPIVKSDKQNESQKSNIQRI